MTALKTCNVFIFDLGTVVPCLFDRVGGQWRINHARLNSLWGPYMGIQHMVSKGIKDGQRPPYRWAAPVKPERLFQRWPNSRVKRVGLGGP
jgi:hypothetical protein